MPMKGKEIRIVTDKHYNRKAWFDTERIPTDMYMPIIVELKDGREIPTRALKTSIAAAMEDPPTTNIQKILSRNPDVNKKLDAAVKALAKCTITGIDSEIGNIFMMRLRHAYKMRASMGYKAEWRAADPSAIEHNIDE
mmetsp:Transcript_6372/g.18744  ORF Transcript_6372/g.18744 Transcript_6372/m.18744 type:complete len:138 (-) Transcript_6372:92-505(-)